MMRARKFHDPIKRRNFLQAGASAGLVTAFTPYAFAAAQPRYDPAASFDLTVSELEYRRNVKGRSLLARIYQPSGQGPYPVVLDLHGGAWNNGDLNDRTGLGEYLAERGVVMVTLNFRHAADGYPTTLQDINYGVRWAKAHAKELKIDPNQVALGGASSFTQRKPKFDRRTHGDWGSV